MRKAGGVGRGGDILHHHKGAGAQRRGHGVGIGHRNHGVGVDDPDSLDLACRHRAEHIDRLQPGFLRHRGALPEVLHGRAVGGVFDLEMAGEGIGQPADLAPAHGIGLAGDREGPHAGAANAAGGKVAVQDRIDLVGAALRLVDALGIERDHLFATHPKPAEGFQIGGGKAGEAGVRGAGGGQRLGQAAEAGQEGRADRPLIGNGDQKRIEQGGIRAGGDGKMQVCNVAGGGAAGVDDHHFHRGPRGFGGGEALVEHRVAPGEV
jgi:hypothetical protein